MYQQNPREDYVDNRKLIAELQGAPSRVYSEKDPLYNIDNCECPECPCCDPDMKWLWPVGAGILAASTPILIAGFAD